MDCFASLAMTSLASDRSIAAIPPNSMTSEGNGFPHARELPRRPALRAGFQQPAAPRTGTFQISSAYSRMVRSEENHGIRATLRIEARVQAGTTCQRASMPRWAS